MDRVLDLVDIDPTKLYKLDQLTSMAWIRTLWNEMTSTTIKNCWRHTGLLRPNASSITSVSTLQNSNTIDIDNSIAFVVPRTRRMSIVQFLNPEGEDDLFQEVTELIMLNPIVDKSSLIDVENTDGRSR